MNNASSRKGGPSNANAGSAPRLSSATSRARNSGRVFGSSSSASTSQSVQKNELASNSSSDIPSLQRLAIHPSKQQALGHSPRSSRSPSKEVLSNTTTTISTPISSSSQHRGSTLQVHNGYSNRGSRAGSGSSNSAGYTTNVIFCPICNEQMRSLALLNQHLDDEHPEEGELGAMFGSWFRKTQKKVVSAVGKTVSRSSSFADNVHHQYLNGPPPQSSGSSSTQNNAMGLGPNSTVVYVGGASETLTEAHVTRKHWQRESPNDMCSNAKCKKTLGLINGRSNCRKCGKLFCDTHVSLWMRLDLSANHEPFEGIWCRVCQKCYTSRDGYTDYRGSTRDHSQLFFAIRRNRIDKANLVANLIEKRLEKLARIYLDQYYKNGMILPGSTKENGVAKSKLVISKSLEQSVVRWCEDDESPDCHICANAFGSFWLTARRRHHCRLCGNLICDDCSEFTDLKYSGLTDTIGENRVNIQDMERDHGAIMVRSCKHCHSTILRRTSVNKSTTIPAIIGLYKELLDLQRAIHNTLPNFNEMLLILEERGSITDKDPEYIQAQKYRKTLMEYFSRIDALAKRIKSLPPPADSPQASARVNKNIVQAILFFLQQHMFTVSFMPKVHIDRGNGRTKSNSVSSFDSTVKVIRLSSETEDGSNYSPGINSPAVDMNSSRTVQSSTESLFRANQEDLQIMYTQKYQLEEMIDDALKRRKLDDLESLKVALKEVEGEIGRIEGENESLARRDSDKNSWWNGWF